MTLSGVAEKLNLSHSNIIHHFGSAQKLQAALMNTMVDDLAGALTKAMESLGPGEARARALVDTVFDAFDEGGAAILAAWIVMSNKQLYLEPVRAKVGALARSVDERLPPDAKGRDQQILSVFLVLALCAFADALVGPQLRKALRTDANAARELAAQVIPAFL